MKTSVLFIMLVFIVLVLMVSRESYISVKGYSKTLFAGGGNHAGESKELGQANSADDCKTKATGFKSWTWRGPNHSAKQKNTCTASNYYFDPRDKSVYGTDTHISACVDESKTFPDCTGWSDGCNEYGLGYNATCNQDRMCVQARLGTTFDLFCKPWSSPDMQNFYEIPNYKGSDSSKTKEIESTCTVM